MTAGIISGAFAAGVYAQDVLERVDAYLRPDFQIVIDGEAVRMDSPVLVYNDTSYLPLKEISQRLGSSVYWKGETKQIYINTRVNTEQRQESPNETYDSIELNNAYSAMLSYLGAEYPVLITSNIKSGSYGRYYRESDVKRMGVDTSGLAKAKDRLTDQVFVHENELQKRWRQTPTQVYTAGYEAYVIADESHPKKTDILRKHIKNMEKATYGDAEFTIKPVMVQKVDGKENTYDFLYQETVRMLKVYVPPIVRYKIARLVINQDVFNPDSLVVNIQNTTDLENEALKREHPESK
ncbi:Copper amine oxidase N-terminal domain-containing protein [Paenibacillus sp. UNCCL117]|uniref:stalk domain-containing protein n=1 Tax=unclassified Paenibacillus TaxID=185978 RepID=UPI000888B9C0|nr:MULTISPECIES: stalk domain-containing protein [unclassified Paenibacillus]SDC78714.1 Copper amine oxidase N-terminal domain-containing protein [Paenibacillus sp. cl123]SFW26129.1 Copper amine oxidase N-terminal domain-containing protein [Paenibacillus sp. UNCCL117]